MKLTSFAFQGSELGRVQVELELISGLPGMTILGLPDPLIKESAHRIQSALIQQGFEWPKAHRIVVHLTPTFGKKSGDGLDLAIALLLLQATEQWVPAYPLNDHFHAYGRLALSGHIQRPGEGNEYLPPPRTGDFLLSGYGMKAPLWRTQVVPQLQGVLRLTEEPWMEPVSISQLWRTPKVPEIHLSSKYKRLISVIVLGEHHALLSGLPGTGKSTLAKALVGFKSPPTEMESLEILKVHRSMEALSHWRPVVSPHHTSSPLALLGGGIPIRVGALSKAHGGLLVMDEFLEFKSAVQESLREPLEERRIHLYRGHHAKTFPAKFQLIATTNLCPCGFWMPSEHQVRGRMRCKCSSRTLSAYQAKLSGPILDRLALWMFMTPKEKGEDTFFLPDLQTELLPLVSGQRTANQDWGWSELKNLMQDSVATWWEELPFQMRRKLQWARVAKTLCDLDGATTIGTAHFEEAAPWALEPFLKWQLRA